MQQRRLFGAHPSPGDCRKPKLFMYVLVSIFFLPSFFLPCCFFFFFWLSLLEITPPPPRILGLSPVPTALVIKRITDKSRRYDSRQLLMSLRRHQSPRIYNLLEFNNGSKRTPALPRTRGTDLYYSFSLFRQGGCQAVVPSEEFHRPLCLTNIV